jgi:hypothetical protein
MVADCLEPGEHLLDTGSARAEQVPGRRVPVGNEDFGGFIVVTDRQVIYKDFFGVSAVKWNDIRHLKKYRVKGLMTTGVEVTMTDGSIWLLSGNTPFIRALLRLSP